MKFLVNSISKDKISSTRITFNGEEVTFPLKVYSRTVKHDINGFYKNINNYIKTLPNETQVKLFEVYKLIDNDFNEINSPEVLKKVLVRRIKTILKLLNINNLVKWVKLHGDIVIPSNLQSEYTDIENELTERLTYLRKDYEDLCCLTVVLKPLLPIFSNYIESISSIVGNKFKELKTLYLLKDTGIFKMDGFKRLSVYIDATIEKEKRKNPGKSSSAAAVLGGLGTTELPDWLLALIVIRKVAVGEETMDNSIIARVYRSLEQYILGLDKTFGGTLGDKNKEYDSGGDEDKSSMVEKYKIKETISKGDIVFIQFYCSDIKRLISDLGVKIDPKIKKAVMSNCNKVRHDIVIGEEQLQLMKWTVSVMLSPSTIPLLNKKSILNILMISQMVLLQWGFEELALVLSSKPGYGNDVETSSIRPTRLNKNDVNKLLEIYPYSKVTSRRDIPRVSNVAIKTINNFSSILTITSWISLDPNAFDNQITDEEGRFFISSDIREDLTKLFIKLNENKNTQVITET